MLINILSSSCPLILSSFGALFSEYTGCLALFLDGLISFSAFLNFAYTVTLHSAVLGFLFSVLTSVILIFLFSLLIEKFKANKFIASIALNLLFSALPSCLSSLGFGTRGVLTSPYFIYEITAVRYFTLIWSILFVVLAVLFLSKTRYGLYLRITGSDSDVLVSKGINPSITRIMGWSMTALYSSFAGCFLSMRLSSFVPNISSGRGWMALAAVFLGQKKTWKITVCMIIFCFADFFSSNIQNIIPGIPSSVLLSFPYLIALCLVFSNRV